MKKYCVYKNERSFSSAKKIKELQIRKVNRLKALTFSFTLQVSNKEKHIAIS